MERKRKKLITALVIAYITFGLVHVAYSIIMPKFYKSLEGSYVAGGRYPAETGFYILGVYLVLCTAEFAVATLFLDRLEYFVINRSLLLVSVFSIKALSFLTTWACNLPSTLIPYDDLIWSWFIKDNIYSQAYPSILYLGAVVVFIIFYAIDKIPDLGW